MNNGKNNGNQDRSMPGVDLNTAGAIFFEFAAVTHSYDVMRPKFRSNDDKCRPQTNGCGQKKI
jgi:hypothetical protein